MFSRCLVSLMAAMVAAGSYGAFAAGTGSDVPSASEMIDALTPGKSPGQSMTRGLRIISNPKPTGEAGANAPAIALNVQFALNSAELTDEAKTVVRNLATAINSDQLASYRFEVQGHTDSTGTPDANLYLSQRRAEAVRDALITEYHVATSRLETVGKGQTEPLDSAHPEAPENRRVQIVNLGAAK